MRFPTFAGFAVLWTAVLASFAAAASVTLTSPEDGFVSQGRSVSFSCSADTTPETLARIELHWTKSGQMQKEAEEQFGGGGGGGGLGTANFKQNGITPGTYQWTCQAVDAQGAATPGEIRTFSVQTPADGEAPQVSITPIPTTLRGNSFTLTVRATDNEGVSGVTALFKGLTYTLGIISGNEQDGQWTRAFTPDEYGGAGTYGIDVTAADAAGNGGSASAQVTIEEPTPPVVVPQNVPDVEYGNDILVRALITDEDGVEAATVRLLGTPYAMALEPGGNDRDGFWSAAIPSSAYTAPGTYALAFEARDIRGSLASGQTATVTVRPPPDSEPPILTVLTPSPHEAGDPLHVQARIQDNLGVSSASVTVRSTAYPLAWESGPLTDSIWGATLSADQYGGPGTLTLDYRALDQQANSGEAPQSLAVQDTRDPVITITSPAEGARLTGRGVMLAYTVADAAFAQSSYTVPDGGSVAAGAAVSVSLAYPADGAYTVTVTAQDAAGRQSTRQVSFTIDSTAPAATEFSVSPLVLAAGQTVNVHTLWSEPVATQLVARQEPSGTILALEDRTAPNITHDFAYQTPVSWIGRYTLYVTAADASGNAGSTPAAQNTALNTITVTDNSGPAVNFTSSLASNAPNRTLQFRLADSTGIDLASLAVAFNGNPAPPACSPASDGKSASCSLAISVSQEGAYPLRVTVKDTQGFESAADFTLIYDATPPPAQTLAVTALRGGNLRLAWTGADDALSPSTQFKVFRGTAANFSLEAPFATGSGREYLDTAAQHGRTYYYRVQVLDGAGNAAITNEASAAANDTVIPHNPDTVTAVSKSGPAIDIKWSATARDVEGNPDGHLVRYRVWRSLKNPEGAEDVSGFSFLGETDKLIYEDKDVKEKVTYYYTVTAVDDAGLENRELEDWAQEYVGALDDLPLPDLHPPRSNLSPASPSMIARFVDRLEEDERFVWRPSLDAMPVTLLAFTARRPLENLDLALSAGQHADLEVAGGKLFRAIAFKHEPLGPTDIEGLAIEFAVPQEWFASQGLRPQEMRLYAKLGDWQQVPLTLQQAGGGFASYAASPPLADAYALVAVKKYFEVETVERRAWETSLGGPASPKDPGSSAPALTGATVFGLSVSAQSLAIPVFLAIMLIGWLGFWATTRLAEAPPTSPWHRISRSAPKKIKERFL